MKKIIVTGATGMLGAHIACRLKQEGYEVTCMQHAASTELFRHISHGYSLDPSAFLWVQADILNTDSLIRAFTGMDIVVHCAALVSYKSRDNSLLHETNVEGTKNCCNVAKSCGLSQFVYTSSIAALGKDPKAAFITEDTPWVDSDSLTEYSRSKYFAELEVWRISEEGLPVSILNPGVIIGNGDGYSGSNAIFNQIQRGLHFYPIGTTGFVGVEDVASAAICMIKNSIFAKRFTLVSENLAYKDLLSFVAGAMGKTAPRIRLGGFLLHFGIAIARFCELFRIPFPYPSQGLTSTSSSFKYKNSDPEMLPEFQYTPVKKSVQTAVAGLKGLV